ncbi:MAG: RNA-binding protein [Holosporaceae bacterium]|jgi:RNA recognition motif-containing protein|nr:RNA-binding protein [Holosporaceae bacterium]
MGKKLYIGNLAYSVTGDMLRNTFSKVGEVESATVVADKVSGRSKGFGFVEMATDDQATAAIERLNRSEFEGRMMFVSESHSGSGDRDSGNRRSGFRSDRRSRE